MKHGKEKVKVKGYSKHKWRCPKCGRAAPEDFCIVHGDVNAVDITKSVKLRKLGLSYSTRTEKETKQNKTKKQTKLKTKRGAITK